MLVVDVARGDTDNERQPCEVGQDVHLGTGFTSVDGAGTGMEAPVTVFVAPQWVPGLPARHDLRPLSVMIEKVVSPGSEALADR